MCELFRRQYFLCSSKRLQTSLHITCIKTAQLNTISLCSYTKEKRSNLHGSFSESKGAKLYTYGLQLNPKKIICDYEKAQYNAFKFHFTNAEIKGCWFHFCQAIYKRSVQEIGIKKVNDYT